MQPPSQTSVILASAVLLGLATAAVAHGHDENMNMDMGEASMARPTLATAVNGTNAAPESYFRYGEHAGLMAAHILLMTVAWIFVLPIGVMLSIAHSRYTLTVQVAFLAVNGVAVLLATIYNASTPDLYPKNAHHRLGWILTWLVTAQAIMGVISPYAGKDSRERGSFIPVSTEAMAEHLRIHDLRRAETYRFSNDSGQGTEPNTESLRSQSIASTGSEDRHLSDVRLDHEEDDDVEKQGLMNGGKVDQFLSKKIPGMLSSRVLEVLPFFYNCIDRSILILGFVALTTGIVTYGGFFKGSLVFSGLAHWIKGGIFFWYGILTLGRWAGCFADIGWAWNIKPSNSRRPSAEFAESFLIFFYGSTNVFLEHLTAWGNAWTAQDLEHLSITIMFFGGGLCGMLIESTRIRNLLNATKQASLPYHPDGREGEEEPKSYKFSMNPIPALIVLLLGMMMSSHHQDSMVSTMIHKQWGTLLMGAAFARAATYVVFYLSPPTSKLPGRPPTELITAFCLMAGGMIFMASARDTVASMELNGLDAMFFFTVSMGVITFLMAWIILVIAIKGLAVRKENKTAFGYHGVS